MQHTKLLKGTAIAAFLAAGCALAGSASAQSVVVAPYGPAYGAPYASPYYDAYDEPYGYYSNEYVPGPVGLGADIVGGAVGVGLTAATAPVWGDDVTYSYDYSTYPSAYDYGYGYGDNYAYPESPESYAYEGPAYGTPYYAESNRAWTVQHQARAAHRMNHPRHMAYRSRQHEMTRMPNRHTTQARQAHHYY